MLPVLRFLRLTHRILLFEWMDNRWSRKGTHSQRRHMPGGSDREVWYLIEAPVSSTENGPYGWNVSVWDAST